MSKCSQHHFGAGSSLFEPGNSLTQEKLEKAGNQLEIKLRQHRSDHHIMLCLIQGNKGAKAITSKGTNPISFSQQVNNATGGA